MSTLNVENIKHPDSSTTSIAFDSAGDSVLSGIPTAPTAAAGTNTTQIATTAFVQAAGGLVHINTTNFTTAASVSVDSVFSATYDNYFIVVSKSTFSNTAGNLELRLRVGGSDNTTSNYARQQIYAVNTSTIFAASSADTSFVVNAAGAADFYTWIEMLQPFASHATGMISNGYTNVPLTLIRNHFFNAATSFDGFTIYPSTGTITGTVRVYGYKNS